MRKVTPMTDSSRRVHLHLPDNYFDMTEDQQRVVCEQMAQALIAQLGVPDEPDVEVHD